MADLLLHGQTYPQIGTAHQVLRLKNRQTPLDKLEEVHISPIGEQPAKEEVLQEVPAKKEVLPEVFAEEKEKRNPDPCTSQEDASFHHVL